MMQDQERARQAFMKLDLARQIEDVREREKYATQCRRMPQLLQQCGVSQTIASLMAKREMRRYR